jgi:hypothetical protein
MRRRVRWWLLGTALALPPFTLHPSPARAAEAAPDDPVRIVRLSGSPYELGRQHGEALREDVRRSVAQVLGYFRGYLKIPVLRARVVNWWLERSWSQSTPFIPREYLEELRGLAAGSGVPFVELCRLHAIPDRTYACSNFAAWGRATKDGRLIHTRNLDWNIEAGIQRFAAVFVVRPAGRRAFVSFGWAGFVGVLTGVNDAQLSIGQVGAETTDATYRGEPMAFLMRRVLEQADGLEEAAAVIREAKRTVGVNYVIADAEARRAVALETTRTHARIFEADDAAERAVAYARPMADAVFRADTAFDPVIRNLQIASDGDPRRPGPEDPSGSSAYSTRYLGQAAGLSAYFGVLDPAAARQIAGAVAPDSNIQSVVFAWPEAWVANAQGTTPAAKTPYHRLDVEQLLTTPRMGQ